MNAGMPEVRTSVERERVTNIWYGVYLECVLLLQNVFSYYKSAQVSNEKECSVKRDLLHTEKRPSVECQKRPTTTGTPQRQQIYDMGYT